MCFVVWPKSLHNLDLHLSTPHSSTQLHTTPVIAPQHLILRSEEEGRMETLGSTPSSITLAFSLLHVRTLVRVRLASNGTHNGSFSQASRVETVTRWRRRPHPLPSLPLPLSLSVCPRRLDMSGFYVCCHLSRKMFFLPSSSVSSFTIFFGSWLHLFFLWHFFFPTFHHLSSLFHAVALCWSLIWLISLFLLLSYFELEEHL